MRSRARARIAGVESDRTMLPRAVAGVGCSGDRRRRHRGDPQSRRGGRPSDAPHHCLRTATRSRPVFRLDRIDRLGFPQRQDYSFLSSTPDWSQRPGSLRARDCHSPHSSAPPPAHPSASDKSSPSLAGWSGSTSPNCRRPLMCSSRLPPSSRHPLPPSPRRSGLHSTRPVSQGSCRSPRRRGIARTRSRCRLAAQSWTPLRYRRPCSRPRRLRCRWLPGRCNCRPVDRPHRHRRTRRSTARWPCMLPDSGRARSH
jgi:hypothetical protein